MMWVLFRSTSVRAYDALLMSTHKICFWSEIKKIINTYWLKEFLSGVMYMLIYFTKSNDTVSEK